MELLDSSSDVFNLNKSNIVPLKNTEISLLDQTNDKIELNQMSLSLSRITIFCLVTALHRSLFATITRDRSATSGRHEPSFYCISLPFPLLS